MEAKNSLFHESRPHLFTSQDFAASSSVGIESRFNLRESRKSMTYMWESSIPKKWRDIKGTGYFTHISQTEQSKDTLDFLKNSQKYIETICKPRNEKSHMVISPRYRKPQSHNSNKVQEKEIKKALPQIRRNKNSMSSEDFSLEAKSLLCNKSLPKLQDVISVERAGSSVLIEKKIGKILKNDHVNQGRVSLEQLKIEVSRNKNYLGSINIPRLISQSEKSSPLA